MTPCQTCKKLDHEVNHPVGMVFVGWGRGWDICPTCNGSGVVPNKCGRCGVTHVEMYMTSVPSCVNREACALRVELRDLRAAAVRAITHLENGCPNTQALAELRKACKVET